MKIDHIGVLTGNIEESKNFYCSLLGFHAIGKNVEDPLQQCRLCLLADDTGNRVELIEPIGNSSPVYRLLQDRPGPAHICYGSANFDDDCARLRKNGCLPTGKDVPAKLFNGKRVIFMLTPNQELLELVET